MIPKPDSPACLTVDEIFQLARRRLAVWFETFARIITKSGEKKKCRQNYLQERLNEACDYCEARGLPVRLIVLKPRQKGSSTWSVSKLYHTFCGSLRAMRCRIIGGKYKQVENLWAILRTYADSDKCTWPATGGMDVLADEARPKKKGIESEIRWETAKDADAGRSGTFQFVLVTELGRWMADGVANASKVLSGLLNCVPHEAGTYVILESTAQGAHGEFYSRYQKAVSLEEFKAGIRGSGFIKVFAPWYVFDDSLLAFDSAEERESLERGLDAVEQDLLARYPGKITLEHLKWRRYTIANDFDGDADLFKQEFPTTEEEAFLMAGRPRIAPDAISRQRIISARWENLKEWGNIREIGDVPARGQLPAIGAPAELGFVWERSDESDGLLVRYEAPLEGYAYLVTVDVMKGASQVSGEDPDCHSVQVLRRGYIDDETGYWHPHALAARIRPPKAGAGSRYRYGCRWDVDVLARQIWRLGRYYGPGAGTCLIVIEMNVDIGLIPALQALPGHILLYQREAFNEREQRKMKQYGWLTTETTRPRVIDGFASAVRQPETVGIGYELRCPHAIAEAEHLIYRDNGRVEAASGWHDDDVLSAGIGLQCLDGATRYSVVKVARPEPPEVRRWRQKQGAMAGDGAGQWG